MSGNLIMVRYYLHEVRHFPKSVIILLLSVAPTPLTNVGSFKSGGLQDGPCVAQNILRQRVQVVDRCSVLLPCIYSAMFGNRGCSHYKSSKVGHVFLMRINSIC